MNGPCVVLYTVFFVDDLLRLYSYWPFPGAKLASNKNEYEG